MLFSTTSGIKRRTESEGSEAVSRKRKTSRFLKAIWRFAFHVYGRLLPFGFGRIVAPLVAWPLHLFGLRRRVAETNLGLAFPETSVSSRRRIARKSLQNLLAVYLEIPRLRYMNESELRRHFRITNLELLTDPEIDHRGGLLLSAHLGNWELLAIGSARLSGREFSVIVKGQNDFDELEQTRTAFGNSVIPLHRAALRASRTLASGGVVAMLADQSAPAQELPVTFFNHSTTAFSTPARLALRYRPKVVAGFTLREKGGGYQVRLVEIGHEDLDDTPEGVALFTRRYLDLLESVIREYPEEWVWQHRRWKRSPGVDYG